ncbi:S8 family serine peptidase [Natronobacillus azotifigens]|uniref:S8 family serine peptidase n=2 Tax=Natronobacillus azotifigens TaxID=472978 RepID=A0A9J6RBL0_9BACI|nr:S8 family serine peptidase [Natronobacillus azotifigens]
MGYEGQGVKVAVLDTGIDYEHPDFEGVYKGGFNFVPQENNPMYARPRDDNDPYETSPLDRAENEPEYSNGNSFYTNHGTHVAGTIAAIGANEYGIQGLAPQVDLYAYRVLGAYGSGQFSWILAGIDKSVEEEMDIINLSLGGGNNDSTTVEAAAINNAALAGVTAVIATGNSGPNRETIGQPAVAPLGIAVGNSTSPQIEYQTELTVEAGDYADQYEAELMAWTFGSEPADILTGTFDVVAVPNIGAASDYEDLNVDGKVALVSRGEIPFVEKIEVAKNAGAVGVILHNNVAGAGPAGFLLGDSFQFIPTADIPTEKGLSFREAIEASEDKLGQVTFQNFVSEKNGGDLVNNSSSRGPTTPYFDIKPDVVAPGTNIMSTVPAYLRDFPEANYETSYDRFTGTSMAAPHVAGVAALLLSLNPDWGPFDLKVAMSNTAKQLDTSQFDVFDQGSGRVQPMKAATAEALAYSLATFEQEYDEDIEHKTGTIGFGNVLPNEEEVVTITRQIEVRNLTDKSSDYEVSIQTTKQPTEELSGAKVSVDKETFTLTDHELLTVTLTVPAGNSTTTNELFGYIQITNGTTHLSLPFAADLSSQELTGLEYMTIDDEAIAPNGNGKFESTTLRYGLYDMQWDTIFEVFDLNDPDGGYYEDGYIGYLPSTLLDFLPGANTLDVDGSYIDWETNEELDIPEGAYAIFMNNYSVGQQLGYVAPFYVKTSNPEISLSDVSEELDGKPLELTGFVEDSFIDYKSTIEMMLGLPYDVNDKLAVQYEITNEEETIVVTDTVELEQDGSFVITLPELEYGTNTLTLTVEDIVANDVTEELLLHVVKEPEEFSIVLTPATTDPTEGPVKIAVDTDSTEELVELKWLAGEKVADDFVESGFVIDLEEKTFEVEENGTYTVFAKNDAEVTTVQTITIDNIVVPPAPIQLVATPSTTEQTEEPVTIFVEADNEDLLVELKWLAGEKVVEDFAEAGEDILEEKAFEVDKNGVYTIYASNELGVEEIITITITNIVDPAAPITIDLSPSTTEPTEGPVSVVVDVETDADLVALKWLAGEKVAADFENAGTDILDTKVFEVTENGVYSVYARNSDGVEVVQLISIENIVEPPAPIESVSLSPSTTEPTEGPVSVVVDVETDADLVALKWLAGEKVAADFENAGTDILDTKVFEVTENGVYSVYARNSDGVEVVQLISIENIIEPPAPIKSVALTPSTTEPTEGKVTISVDIDTDAELAELKWLAGEKTVADFENAGEDFLATRTFEVSENGVYTVFVLTNDGVAEVHVITVDNIVESETEDPDPDPDPNPDHEPEPDSEEEEEKPGDSTSNKEEKSDSKDVVEKEDVEISATEKKNEKPVSGNLPDSATPIFNYLTVGFLLSVIGVVVLLFLHLKKKKRKLV